MEAVGSSDTSVKYNKLICIAFQNIILLPTGHAENLRSLNLIYLTNYVSSKNARISSLFSYKKRESCPVMCYADTEGRYRYSYTRTQPRS
jgi:hypothetical protein